MSHRRKGISIEHDEPGVGAAARRGDTVTIRNTLSLSRGDVIYSDQVATFAIGRRTVIAGLEYGIEGMRIGGRRRFRALPHLCYREAGVPDQIPPNAVLVFDVQVLDVRSPESRQSR